LKRLGESNSDAAAAAALPVLLTISDDTDSDDYEDLVRNAPDRFDIRWPAEELDPITLNYTSGTTSRPKGVVYSHRGAYLNTIATVLAYDITAMPTYLWTVPMFHCNGWNLPWGVAMQGGTNVCLRHFNAGVIFDSIARHGVTHMGGAPTVLNMIANAPAPERRPLPGPVRVMTGGAPPPPRVLFAVEELGFVVYHIYGLTETYGPATVCTWMPEWDALPAEDRARLKARQGFHHIAMQAGPALGAGKRGGRPGPPTPRGPTLGMYTTQVCIWHVSNQGPAALSACPRAQLATARSYPHLASPRVT
jgi:acyl-CoA synthetase (AMP-forming)/AMP-acid ligase II